MSATNDPLSDVESAPARERLAELLDLDAVRRTVKRVRVHGRGGHAHVRIDLDNGDRIVLDPVGAYSAPARMNFEISTQVGSKPALKKPADVQELATLIFWLAEQHAASEAADVAWELGAEYLRGAVLCDVVMSDQTSRWAAFEHLHKGTTSHSTVLLDARTGGRYVRAQWLTEFLRPRCDAGEVGLMKAALERLGWGKAGQEGRIKATHPKFPRTLQWSFLIVPDGWEHGDEDAG
jgi:hypothetical protein